MDSVENNQTDQRLEKLEKEVRALKNSEKTSSKTKDENVNISRRQFLKKAGLGTAGLAMLGLAPASALDVRSNDFNVYTSSSETQALTIDSNQNVEVTDGELRVQGSIKDGAGNKMLDNVVDSGQVALSSGSAVVDTGLSTTSATFSLAIGVNDPDADAKVSGRLYWDDSAGTYKVEIVETETSANPTVNYDIIRVR